MKDQTRLMARNAAVKFIIDLFGEEERRDRSIKQVWHRIIHPLFHIGYATSLECRKSFASDFDADKFVGLLRMVLDRYDKRRKAR